MYTKIGTKSMLELCIIRVYYNHNFGSYFLIGSFIGIGQYRTIVVLVNWDIGKIPYWCFTGVDPDFCKGESK